MSQVRVLPGEPFLTAALASSLRWAAGAFHVARGTRLGGRRFAIRCGVGGRAAGASLLETLSPLGRVSVGRMRLPRAESAGPGDLRSAKTLHPLSQDPHPVESVVVVITLVAIMFTVFFRFVMVVTSMTDFELIVASRANPFDRRWSRQQELPVDGPFDLY